jgi:hypothetical protein
MCSATCRKHATLVFGYILSTMPGVKSQPPKRGDDAAGFYI